MKNLLDAVRVKALANELQRSSSAIGTRRPLASFYESLAHEQGLKDWNTYSALLSRHTSSDDQPARVAYAMLSWRGSEFAHSLVLDQRDAPARLAKQAQAKLNFSLEGLMPTFSRIDRPGLPRASRPPLLVLPTPASSSPRIVDAWPVEQDAVPRVGDCTPFSVDFWSDIEDRENGPHARGLVWFLVERRESGEPLWAFDNPKVGHPNPIYSFLEELRQGPIPRRSALHFDADEQMMMTRIDGESSSQRLSVPARAASHEWAEAGNKAMQLSRMDVRDILRMD